MSTITSTVDPLVVITPDLVLGYSATRPVRNQHTEILGRPDPESNLREAGSRRGSMELLFASLADAAAAYAALSGVDVWEFTDPDTPELGMLFVLDDGDITLDLDPETRAVWLVGFPFVEVVP